MVFGKGQQIDVIKLGQKGGKKSNKLHGSNFSRLWKNEEWRKKKSKEASDRITQLNNAMTPEEFRKHCSNAGKKSRERENKVIEKIKEDYDILFMPFRVCDRIAIKDNKLIFIEVKSKKRKTLRPKQKEFKDICDRLGIGYRIITD